MLLKVVSSANHVCATNRVSKPWVVSFLEYGALVRERWLRVKQVFDAERDARVFQTRPCARNVNQRVSLNFVLEARINLVLIGVTRFVTDVQLAGPCAAIPAETQHMLPTEDRARIGVDTNVRHECFTWRALIVIGVNPSAVQ